MLFDSFLQIVQVLCSEVLKQLKPQMQLVRTIYVSYPNLFLHGCPSGINTDILKHIVKLADRKMESLEHSFYTYNSFASKSFD